MSAVKVEACYDAGGRQHGVMMSYLVFWPMLPRRTSEKSQRISRRLAIESLGPGPMVMYIIPASQSRYLQSA